MGYLIWNNNRIKHIKDRKNGWIPENSESREKQLNYDLKTKSNKVKPNNLTEGK